MQLTAEEKVAVENGRLLRYVIPESQVECVILRSDKFDPLTDQPDFGACPPDDFLPLMSELLDDEDWTLPDDRGRPHERSQS